MEVRRLAAIAEYGLLDAPGEPEFDHIVSLAASLFDVPISLISIVDENQQFFVARTGLDAAATDRRASFCAHALDKDDVMVVENATLDWRFADNPLVLGPPYIRFYAGAPLRVASGHILGTLCIISPEPRAFEPLRAQQLESLAQLLVDRLELRRSERRRRVHEARLARLAHFDSLTGLPNRARFHEHAEALLAAHPSSAMLLFDLDGFKDVNDVLGHAVGDRLLAAVGDRLQTDIGGDRLLARLGGDEFALLLPGIGDPREAYGMAIDLRNSFRRGFMLDSDELQLDTSIGIAIAPHHGATVDTLLMAADLALYRAKDQGGGTVGFFEPHLRHGVEARRRLKGELRQAFEEAEFELLYQPQFDLRAQRIVGAEALLRWNHPEHGKLSPAQFIDILERMPLAAAVGSWVIRVAIEQAAQWNREGFPLRVGVNLFAAQFRSGNLPERVAAKLADHKLPAHLLEIELTETVAVKNGRTVLSALTSLREQGVGVALDDFGTGYASLSLLKELPVTRLKIDRGFIGDMAPGGADAAVVEAILRMAESFSLAVIAEGVETVEQERWLADAGCREAQGYLYGKPMTPSELIELMRNSSLPMAALVCSI